MGLFDTPANRKRQHLQLIATGNIRDIDRIQQRDRKRHLFIVLNIILAISIFMGIGFIAYNGDYTTGIILIAIGLFIIVYLIFKKRKHKHYHKLYHHHRQKHNNYRHKNKHHHHRR